MQKGANNRFRQQLDSRERTWKSIIVIPFVLPVVLIVFGTVAMVLLLIGQLKNGLVWPLGIIMSLGALWLLWRKLDISVLPGSVRERRLVGLAVLLLVIGWMGFNGMYTSQNVFIHRDPSVYANTALWIKNHANLDVPASNVFGKDPSLHAESDDFGSISTTPNRLYPGGLHLLPVLLGLGARVGGGAFMLHLNVVIGGLALLATYGFASCLTRPRWALLAMGILAVSLPMIYFSRDTYSEPLDLLAVFGGLSLLWFAQSSKENKGLLWFLAGLTIGATTMTRIDAYVVLASMVIFLVIFVAIAKEQERRNRLLMAAFFVAGAALTTLVGWLDLTQLSARYYHDLRHQSVKELLLIVALCFAGLVSVVLAWRTSILTWLDRRTQRWRSPALVIIGIVTILFLLSRPLWFVGHGAFHNGLVAGLQNLSGAPIDDTRTYAEWSAFWIIWYIGPIAALGGAVGLLMMLSRITVNRKSLLFMPLVLTVGATAALYLYNPNISPDQIWASRRFVPVVMPGFCVLAAFAFDNLGKIDIVKRNIEKPFATVGLVLLIEAILAAPLFISYPFLRVREFVPELAQVKSVCAALPDKAAVLIIGKSGNTLTQPTRTHCKIPVEWIADPSTSELEHAQAAATKAGYVPVAEVLSTDRDLLPSGSKLTEVSTVNLTLYALSLDHPPHHTTTASRTILLGLINKRGEVAAL